LASSPPVPCFPSIRHALLRSLPLCSTSMLGPSTTDATAERSHPLLCSSLLSLLCSLLCS
jgi:hypothetical protein